MPEERTRVLYIAGSGRSGSTLVDNVLGQVPGYFSAGEIRFLWERGLKENRLCGCGVPFRECPFWTEVFERAFGGFDAVDAEEMIRAQRQGTRARHVPRIISSRDRRDPFSGRIDRFRESLRRLYGVLAEVSGSSVIVDSSKLPTYGYVLETMPSIDLAVLHLVRDPRAAAYSWSSKKALTDRAARSFMEQQGPAKSSMLWSLWNLAAEMFWSRYQARYLRVRYEDVIASPREHLRRVLRMLGDEDAALPFTDDRTALLRPNHTVAGNPDRLRSGPVEIRADERWKTNMPASEKALVTLWTVPLLRRYGFPINY